MVGAGVATGCGCDVRGQSRASAAPAPVGRAGRGRSVGKSTVGSPARASRQWPSWRPARPRRAGRCHAAWSAGWIGSGGSSAGRRRCPRRRARTARRPGSRPTSRRRRCGAPPAPARARRPEPGGRGPDQRPAGQVEGLRHSAPAQLRRRSGARSVTGSATASGLGRSPGGARRRARRTGSAVPRAGPSGRAGHAQRGHVEVAAQPQRERNVIRRGVGSSWCMNHSPSCWWVHGSAASRRVGTSSTDRFRWSFASRMAASSLSTRRSRRRVRPAPGWLRSVPGRRRAAARWGWRPAGRRSRRRSGRRRERRRRSRHRGRRNSRWGPARRSKDSWYAATTAVSRGSGRCGLCGRQFVPVGRGPLDRTDVRQAPTAKTGAIRSASPIAVSRRADGRGSRRQSRARTAPRWIGSSSQSRLGATVRGWGRSSCRRGFHPERRGSALRWRVGAGVDRQW